MEGNTILIRATFHDPFFMFFIEEKHGGTLNKETKGCKQHKYGNKRDKQQV